MTRKTRGKIGNLVYRVWRGTTIVSKLPDYRNMKWSKAQKKQRKRFSEAMHWAQSVLLDPGKMKYYTRLAKGKMSPYNAAVQDYLDKPYIYKFNVSKYNGRAGNTIKFGAHKDYGIEKVVVGIVNAQGYELESNVAIELNDGYLGFTASENNPLWQSGGVTFSITDSLGRITKEFRPFRN